MGLRGEAGATMAQGRQAIAQSQKTLSNADHQLDTLKELLVVAKSILEQINVLMQSIAKNGIDVNPKVGETEIPVGANISTRSES